MPGDGFKHLEADLGKIDLSWQERLKNQLCSLFLRKSDLRFARSGGPRNVSREDFDRVLEAFREGVFQAMKKFGAAKPVTIHVTKKDGEVWSSGGRVKISARYIERLLQDDTQDMVSIEQTVYLLGMKEAVANDSKQHLWGVESVQEGLSHAARLQHASLQSYNIR